MSAKKILLLGTHGQYNIGDELLLETFLYQLGDQYEYTVNSYDPDFTMRQLGEQYNLKVFHTVQGRWAILDYILKCDLIFFGGGSIIKELYASVGRNRYSTLLMVLAIVSFSKFIGRKPIIMSNIGIGPIETKFGLFLAKLIFSMVKYVSVRDQKSFDTCQQMKLNNEKFDFVPDAVFVHKPSFFVQKQAPLQERNGNLIVALNLNYNIEHPEQWESFIQNLAEGFQKVHQQQPIQIHALPMQSGYKIHNDLEILTEFRSRIPEIDVLLHNPVTPQDIGKIISKCDLVVSERLHTCIAAALMGKPLLPLIYDVKVREMAQLIGVAEFGLEIDATFSATKFERTFLLISDQIRQIENHLLGKTAALRKQTGTYFQALNQRIEKLN